MAYVIDCLSLAELDEVNLLAGEIAVSSYQAAVLGHELKSYRSRRGYSTLHFSPNLCT